MGKLLGAVALTAGVVAIGIVLVSNPKTNPNGFYADSRKVSQPSKLETRTSEVFPLTQPTTITPQIQSEAPRMVGFNQVFIEFSDNEPADGMKAYAVVPGQEDILYLVKTTPSGNNRKFLHPPASLYPEYGVLAVDINGNISQPTYFEVADDAIRKRKN